MATKAETALLARYMRHGVFPTRLYAKFLLRTCPERVKDAVPADVLPPRQALSCVLRRCHTYEALSICVSHFGATAEDVTIMVKTLSHPYIRKRVTRGDPSTIPPDIWRMCPVQWLGWVACNCQTIDERFLRTVYIPPVTITEQDLRSLHSHHYVMCALRDRGYVTQAMVDDASTMRHEQRWRHTTLYRSRW
jgi:hypothetical protein